MIAYPLGARGRVYRPGVYNTLEFNTLDITELARTPATQNVPPSPQHPQGLLPHDFVPLRLSCS